jgi:hypothetical protein
MICPPVGPRCDGCNLSTAGLSPSAKKSGSSKMHQAVVKGSPGPEVEIALEVEEDSSCVPELSALETRSHGPFWRTIWG